MAHYTNDARVGNKVHLYTEMSEEPSELNSIKHLLKNHNRLHTISFVLHAVWLLVIIVLLILLLKSPTIPQMTATVARQVGDSTRPGQTSTTERYSTTGNSLKDVQSKFEEQVQALNLTVIQVSDRQQVLSELLQNMTKHLEGMEKSANKSLEYLSGLAGVLPVYNQEHTTTKYLYQDGLPAMSEMTACFWFNIEYYDGSMKSGTLISIAVPGQSNELMLDINWYGKPRLWVRNSYLWMTNAADMDTLWGGWNRHCFTWKAGYQAKWYTDRISNGRLELMASVNVSRDTVRSGGHMTLLQDQDSFGGDIDLSQTHPGKLADFNLWKHEMTADQINALTCGSVGDVASWDTLKQQGTGQMTYEEFPLCADRVLPVYNQQSTLSHYRYQTPLPAMSEMSTCFWFNGLASDDRNGDFLVSVAITQERNELIIGWQYSGQMSLYIQDNATEFPLNAQYDDKNTLWVGWHKHCFTFKAGDKAKWYTDLATSGFVELVSTIDVSSNTIREGGYMTLLQEQDSVGGGFDLSQTVPGKMAEFNMWNYQIAEEDINSNTCGGEGNVVSWDTLQYFGSSNITYEIFPLCDH